MPFKLKKDIVIPAGTMFHCIDHESRNYVDGNYSYVFGLTPNTVGEMVYGLGDFPIEESDWFEEVE